MRKMKEIQSYVLGNYEKETVINLGKFRNELNEMFDEMFEEDKKDIEVPNQVDFIMFKDTMVTIDFDLKEVGSKAKILEVLPVLTIKLRFNVHVGRFETLHTTVVKIEKWHVGNYAHDIFEECIAQLETQLERYITEEGN
jgi:antitoxin component HigA of HigAB toxin-antitoxin module